MKHNTTALTAMDTKYDELNTQLLL